MNKFSSVLIPIVIGVVVVVVAVVILVIVLNNGDDQNGDDPLFKGVEVITNPGTKVFAKLPEGAEQFLNSAPKLSDGKFSQITVDVPVDADIILRYENKEEVIAYEEWKEERAISVDFNVLISIKINAQPEAYVFIKLPDGDDFIEPRTQDFIIPPEPGEPETNLTPIRGGGLKIPIGTMIKLKYRDEEKSFPYEIWKEDSRISHNFLNP